MDFKPYSWLRRRGEIDIVLEPASGTGLMSMNYISPRLTTISGYPLAEIYGRPLSVLIPSDRRVEVLEKIRNISEQPETKIIDLPLERHNGGEVWTTCGLSRGPCDRFCLHLSLLTLFRHNKIWTPDLYLNKCDSITGLPGREFFLNRLEDTLKKSIIRARRMVVLLLDIKLERLRKFADEKAEAIFLENLSSRLVGLVSSEDIVTRLGDSKLGIIISDVEKNCLPPQLENLADQGRLLLDIDNRQLELSVDVEVIAYPSFKGAIIE
jgi:GGDEF domain-containing protein